MTSIGNDYGTSYGLLGQFIKELRMAHDEYRSHHPISTERRDRIMKRQQKRRLNEIQRKQRNYKLPTQIHGKHKSRMLSDNVSDVVPENFETTLNESLMA